MALKAGPKGDAGWLDLSSLPPELAARRIAFMQQFCGVTLYPHQRKTLRVTGRRRRPRVAYKQVPRKNGKTMEAASLGLTEMCLLDRRHIYAISDSERNLNSVLIRELRDLVFSSAKLSDAIHVSKSGLECPSTGSFIEARPNNFRASQGINPHLVIFDEVHLQKSDEVWNGMQMAGAARPDALLFGITTPGYDLTSHAHDLYVRVKAGDPSIFGSVYEPTNPECSPDDHSAWRKANPCYSRPGFRAAMEFDRLTMPEHEFRRFRLGQWTATASAWLPYGAWDRCADPNREVLDGDRIVLGFDGSFSGDSTALMGCTLDFHLWPLGIWENPGRKGWRVPRNEVNAAVDRAFSRYRVLELAADPPYWGREIEEWQERYGERKVLEFPTNQRTRMAPATTDFYAAVMEGTLTHDGDPRLARHIANAIVRPTAQGDVITKDDKDSPAKIDGAVASIVAHSRAMFYAPRSRPRQYVF